MRTLERRVRSGSGVCDISGVGGREKKREDVGGDARDEGS